MYSGQYIVFSSQTLEQILPYEERFSNFKAFTKTFHSNKIVLRMIVQFFIVNKVQINQKVNKSLLMSVPSIEGKYDK